MKFRELINLTEEKTPKWSFSKKKWIDADADYIEALEDIVDELKAMKNIKELKKWAAINDADFDIVE